MCKVAAASSVAHSSLNTISRFEGPGVGMDGWKFFMISWQTDSLKDRLLDVSNLLSFPPSAVAKKLGGLARFS